MAVMDEQALSDGHNHAEWNGFPLQTLKTIFEVPED
jgi:hypothetical protein